MIKTAFPAMGTMIEVFADSEDHVAETRALFKRHESRFSRFSHRSELTQMNDDPRESIQVSSTMADLLGLAQRLKDLTGGVFDPAVGAHVIHWGYDRTFDEMVPPSAPPGTGNRGSWRIDGRSLSRTTGTRLDLGGLAKGWTADRAVGSGLAHLVSAGGDLRSALPTTEVEIDDATGASGIVVTLGTGGLATSSIMKRAWKVGDRSAHHIVDPRTLAPADSPVLSASAICRTATEAEAAAKTALILGGEGLRWAERQDWVAAAMVTWHDGSVFATSGWELAA